MKWNKYDCFLVVLIASLATGGLGGALSVPRILSVVLSPFLVCRLLERHYRQGLWFTLFFFIWFLYASFSLLWTSDIEEAFKEMVYYPVHFVLFLEIVFFAFYSSNPLKSIAVGWCCGFLCTSVIAGWELLTDNHLFMTKQQSGLKQNFGSGEIFLRNFCSVTFGNYNSYVTYIAFAFPFLLYSVFKNIFNRFVSVLCLALPFIFIGQNASRGGILAITGMLALFLLLQKRNNKKLVVLIIFAFLSFIYIFSFTDAFTIIFLRIGKTTLEESRFELWSAAIDLWKSTFYIGSGIGSMIVSMGQFSNRLLITHNLFLEILVQYGFVIFVPFLVYYVKGFLRTIKKRNIDAKSVAFSALCLLPISSVIDSGYLLNPVTFVYFASLEVFISYENT